MSLLVGFAPDGRGKAVLHLAGMLARSADDDLVVCAIVPAPWYPSPARVDAGWRRTIQVIRVSGWDTASSASSIRVFRAEWPLPTTATRRPA